ncbi:hypothetical protein L798_15551 [Zootermopsis nevadensis]|uniref:Uncharacterized protein n=1 Tax=Zootermopsis nevadensis TaxID=136037 RepID=A0A067QWI8_ZOONE|nr:hypothetical protein L798_15551 [Zootermopsis nevadensis]
MVGERKEEQQYYDEEKIYSQILRPSAIGLHRLCLVCIGTGCTNMSCMKQTMLDGTAHLCVAMNRDCVF